MADDIASLMFAASQKLTDQQFPDLKQMATLAALNQRTELERQKAADLAQNRNTLASVFSNPGNFDEKTNMLNPQGLAGLRRDPNAFMDYTKLASTVQHNQLVNQAQGSKNRLAFEDEAFRIKIAADARYQQNLTTMGQEAAEKQLAEDLAQGRRDLAATGLGDPAAIEQMNARPIPNAQQNMAEIMGYRAARAKPPAPMSDYQRQVEWPLAIKKDERADEDQRRARRAEERAGIGTPGDREITLPDGTTEKANVFYDKTNQRWAYSQGGAPLPEGAKIKDVAKASGSTDAQLLEKFREERNAAGNPATSAEEAAFMRSLRAPRSASAITLQKAMEENPTWTSADIASFNAWNRARSDEERAFGSGDRGKATRAMNVAIDHLTALDELVNALHHGTDIRTIERLSNWAKTEFNLSTAPTSMEAARSIIGSEIVKAVQGGATALADREEARAPLDPSLSAEQLRDVIKVNKRLMAGQLRGLEQEYVSAVVPPAKRGDAAEEEKARKAYRYKLFPDTLTELEGAHTPGAPASTKGAARGESGAAPARAPIRRAGPDGDYDFDISKDPNNEKEWKDPNNWKKAK